jgi:bacterial/archaeal transporter family-2 protein
MTTNSSLLYLLLALLGGALIPVQTSMNAALSRALGGPFYASLAVFGIAALAMTVVIGVLRAPVPMGAQLAAAPWWGWLGGVIGAIYIFLLVFLAPRIGIATATGFVVGGQILAAVLIDHFGLFGFARHALNLPRLGGVALLLAGLWLIKKF